MAAKDNANPIIYAPTSSTLSGRGGAAAAGEREWWRDPSIHSSHATSSALANDTLAFTVADDDHEDDLEADHVDDAQLSTTAAGQGKLDRDDELIDSQEVYDLIRSITDPEHPLTLEQLAVVNAAHIVVEHGDEATNKLPHVLLEFTPTIPHCSMATLIGLSLRVRLLRSLPPRYKVDIRVREGTHQSENAVNKQLNDKERVAAALENAHLLDVVQGCLASASRRGKSGDEWAEGEKGEEVWRTVEEVAKRMGVDV